MILIKRSLGILGAILLMLATVGAGRAQTIEYDLTVARESVNITGSPAAGMTINGSIPGPILRFRIGDTARIQVHNKMDTPTSIHWHGVLLPPGMDGVPYVSFAPIGPGASFTYEFSIRQSGTYWYHSHSGLQEQSGVYGAVVISPRHDHLPSHRDHVVLLSDWTDEDPHSVNRTLRRGSEWYALEKGSGQSILGAARAGRLGDYFKRELRRMPAMDISDVAYDRFLANGRPQLNLPAAPHETVRLRIIDGSATTYFHLEFAGGPMTIVAADGQDVEPLAVKRFLIGVAETYDVLVRLPANGAYELRATAHDGSAIASVWLGSGERHPAPEVPKPDLYAGMGHAGATNLFAATPAAAMGMSDAMVEAGMFDRPGMMGMHHEERMDHGKDTDHGKDMDHDKDLDHSKDMDRGKGTPAHGAVHAGHGDGMQAMPEEGFAPMTHETPGTAPMAPDEGAMADRRKTKYNGKAFGGDYGWLAADISSAVPLASDGPDTPRPWAPYASLRSVASTAFDPHQPVRTVRLTLDGDMRRYVWFINNKPISESDVIPIRAGEIVRFILINRTMMHHPMHLHGHFFRVVNGQGDHAPLKHTVDVAPMSTTIIEFEANEVGDWFFHCHLLYHMKNGMARIIHYRNYSPDPEVARLRPKLLQDPWVYYGQADLLSHMTEGILVAADRRNTLAAEWEVGWQGLEGTHGEGILTWERYVNRFFGAFIGVDRIDEGDDAAETRAVLGISYLLPLNIASRSWIDSDGGVRIGVEKDFELTPRLALDVETQYDSHDHWEGSAGLSYLVNQSLSLLGRWHSEFGWGAGVQVRF